MWIARLLLFVLAQAIVSGIFEGFQEFLLARTAARQQGFFLWAKEPSPAAATAAAASSSHGLASFFFGHPHAVVHSFDEENFVETVIKGAGAGTGTGAPWLIHLYSPYDAAAVALNKLLEDEVAPILFLSSALAEEEGTAPGGVKLHIGKINVVAHPYLASSLGWPEDEEEEDEEGDEHHQSASPNLAPHRSILKIVRTPAPASSSSSRADHHQQQQPLQLPLLSAGQGHQQQQQPPAASASIPALSRRLVAENYHGRRTRQALLGLAEHASTSASLFSSLYALPTPTRLATPAELAAFRAEHPFVFLLVAEPEPAHEQEQQGLGGDDDDVLRLAFVSTCEARMWRHCALVSRAALPLSPALPVVTKLERGDGLADAEPFPVAAVAFARRPEALREWLQAHNYPLVSPMPLALEGPAFDRLLRAGGRLVVARVRGGSGGGGEQDEDSKAVMERLLALGRDGAYRSWLRAGRVRLGYVVEGGPRTQLPLGAAGEGTGTSLARLVVVDGPTRGVYNVEHPEALEGVLRGVAEGRMRVPTFPLVRKDDPFGAYPHVAKLLAQVHTLAAAVAAAVALALVLGLLVLLSPRRWWVPGAAEDERKRQPVAMDQEPPLHQSPQRLMAKFGSGDIAASVTGAGALLMESEM